MSGSASGPTCSPSTTMYHVPWASAGAGLGSAAASAAGAPPLLTTMMWLHFLHRILKAFPWTFSSAIEYLAWQESQTIFIGPSFTRTTKKQ